MNKILKAYLVYFVGAYGLYGLSHSMLSTAEVIHSRAKAGEGETVEYRHYWVVTEALRNFKEVYRLLKDSYSS